MATPGLLAWITTCKYLDHLPLYRTAQIAAREGVTLSLSTLAEWIGRVGVALQPLVDRLILHLLQGRVLHADETPVAQLDPGSEKTQRAYLWACRSNDSELGPRIIVFDYQISRTCAANSSTCTKPTQAPLHSKHCNASVNFTPSKQKASTHRPKPGRYYVQKKACRSCNRCTTGYCKPASYRRWRRHRQSHRLHLEALAKPNPLRQQRTPAD